MRFVQKVSLAFGLAFIGAAVMGFLSGGMSMDANMATATRVGGLFPVNAAHNALHLALGLWGVGAARNARGAKRYCTISGAAYLVLAGLGFVLPDIFGFIPIGGWDIALHGVFGATLTAVGATTDLAESVQTPALGR